MHEASRRDFLSTLGTGAVVAWAGTGLARDLGAAATLELTPRAPRCAPPADLEQLIATMQETAPDALMGKLVEQLRGGRPLQQLVAAGAVANARAFAGLDYDGYHAQMALLPAQSMAALMPPKLAALPVLKVLHRSTKRMQKTGGARNHLTAIPKKGVSGDAGAELQRRTRKGEMRPAEELFGAIAEAGPEAAFEQLQALIRDEHNVHRIVLAWRSWDILPVIGEEHSAEMLRQFVRFCVDHEQQRRRQRKPAPTIRTVVPDAIDEHKLFERGLGQRKPDDAFVARLTSSVFGSDRKGAANEVAAALAEGFDPDAIAEAIALAGNKLLLHDTGAERVHGASVGVHASDAANAWRHLARLGSAQNRIANLVAAAYHTGGQSPRVGKREYSFQTELEQLSRKKNGDELLRALTEAIEQRDQKTACAAARRYGDLDLPAAPIFDKLLGYAVSEDGALHAEKYFHTVREEFRTTRPALRWRHVVALARVTASEFGQRAPGYDLARRLLSS